MKIRHLFGCVAAIAVLAAMPAIAQDGKTATEEKKPPAAKNKPIRPHPERHGVTPYPVYGCPEAGASCSVSCANGNGSITCRVGEVCTCTCSGNYPQCSCD